MQKSRHSTCHTCIVILDEQSVENKRTIGFHLKGCRKYEALALHECLSMLARLEGEVLIRTWTVCPSGPDHRTSEVRQVLAMKSKQSIRSRLASVHVPSARHSAGLTRKASRRQMK